MSRREDQHIGIVNSYIDTAWMKLLHSLISRFKFLILPVNGEILKLNPQIKVRTI